MLSVFPKDTTFSGVLVFENERGSAYILVSTEDGSQLQIPGDSKHLISPESVSPDGNWLAYYQVTFKNDVTDYSGTPWVLLSEELVVIDTEGLLISSVPKQERWQYFTGQWVDNERVLIERIPPYLVRFNPFSHLWDEFSIDVPGRYFDDYDQVKVAVNPVYDLFVYLHEDLDRLILWDWKDYSPVGEIPLTEQFWHDHATMNSAPVWAPDGERFAITGFQSEWLDLVYPPTQIYLVSRTGDLQQLTKFPEDLDVSYEIGLYSWSPDGTKIAAWINFNRGERPDQELVVIDVESGEAMRYCVFNNVEITDPLETRTDIGDTRIPPIWSPDGQSILVQSAVGIAKTQVTLIDLVDQIAVRLDFGAIPVGWMKSGE